MSEAKWMHVEIMGHRQHVGLVSEVSAFGATMMRVEALQRDGSFSVHHYGGPSIFSYREVTEETARKSVMGRSYYACDTFTQPSALAGSCASCGHTEEEHKTAAQLPARREMSIEEIEDGLLEVVEDNEPPGDILPA